MHIYHNSQIYLLTIVKSDRQLLAADITRQNKALEAERSELFYLLFIAFKSLFLIHINLILRDERCELQGISEAAQNLIILSALHLEVEKNTVLMKMQITTCSITL